MDSSFYTRVGEGKYEVHFETGEKWKYVLVEAACREAIGHGKAFMVTENIVRCGECKYRDPETKGCDCAGHEMVMGGIIPMPDDWFCADGRRKVQE